MRVVILSSSGAGARVAALRESLDRHDPGTSVTVVATDPRALTGGRGVVTIPPDLPVGGDGAGLRYADVHLGWGSLAARLVALAAAVGEHPVDEPTVVLPDHAWLTAPIGTTVASWASPQAPAVTVVPQQLDHRTGVPSGGLVPEVLVLLPGAGPVLNAWASALVERCAAAPDPIDPWRDVVEAGGPVGLWSDRGWALTPWTIAHADVVEGPGGWRFDGSPLVVAQFCDFDPASPWWYAPPGGGPLRSVADSPGLRSLCRAYAAALDAPTATAASRTDPGRLGSDAVIGLPVDDRLRADFRAEWHRRRVEGRERPANPYVAGEAQRFLDWRTGPGDPQLTDAGLVADGVWRERPDLATAFPQVRSRHQGQFRRWMWTHGLSDGVATLIELPDPPARPVRIEVTHEPKPFGANLVGYHGSEAGLGVAVRRIGLALDAAHIPWHPVTYTRTSSRQLDVAGASGPEVDHHFSLVLITADQLPLFVADGGGRWLDDHYAIGLWYWEADVMPPSQVASFDLVDEAWGATEYLRRVFAAHTDKPVRRIPLPFRFAEPDRSDATRQRLGLDDRFTFLFTFDFLSVAQRKNPMGVIEAYRRAFPTPGEERLILKTINGELFRRELEEVRDATADRPDIELWDRYLDPGDRLSLVALADCYVSLHRSEGLGLTMAEAMAVATPVVASRYSGNLDFMDDTSALLVDGTEVLIGPGSYYPADAHWYDPDLDHAATLLRRIRSDEGLRQLLVERARMRIDEFSPEAVGEAISQRLTELWAAR